MLKVAGAEEHEAYNLALRNSVCLVCMGGLREKANSAECLTAVGIVWQLEECSLSKFFQGFYV